MKPERGELSAAITPVEIRPDKALIAVAARPLLEKEARERQLAGQKSGGKKAKTDKMSTFADDQAISRPCGRGLASEEAGNLMGISPATVDGERRAYLAGVVAIAAYVAAGLLALLT